MDKVFLLNISTIFIAIRFDIKYPFSIELLSVTKRNFDNGGLNEPFLAECQKIDMLRSLEWCMSPLSGEKSTSVSVDQNFVKVFSRVLSEVICLLQEGSLEQAYDVVDAFHWLPKAVASGEKIRYVDFFINRIIPLRKKWGTTFTDELYSLLSLNKFAKMRLRMKMGHSD